MALSKQSIRKNMHIKVNSFFIKKEELILMSELWTEKEEKLFRKMLKQGGTFRLGKSKFEITPDDDVRKRSDGSRDSGVVKIPGEDGKF